MLINGVRAGPARTDAGQARRCYRVKPWGGLITILAGMCRLCVRYVTFLTCEMSVRAVPCSRAAAEQAEQALVWAKLSSASAEVMTDFTPLVLALK